MPDYGLDTLSREDLLGPAKAPAPVAATPAAPKAPAVDYGLGAMSTQDLLGGPVDPTAEAEKAAALFEASFKDPTEEVKRRNLSKSIEKLTGIFTPASVMDVKDSERAFRRQEADHATRASPRTSAFLSIQENADVAMQDAKTMAQIEKIVDNIWGPSRDALEEMNRHTGLPPVGTAVKGVLGSIGGLMDTIPGMRTAGSAVASIPGGLAQLPALASDVLVRPVTGPIAAALGAEDPFTKFSRVYSGAAKQSLDFAAALDSAKPDTYAGEVLKDAWRSVVQSVSLMIPGAGLARLSQGAQIAGLPTVAMPAAEKAAAYAQSLRMTAPMGLQSMGQKYAELQGKESPQQAALHALEHGVFEVAGEVPFLNKFLAVSKGATENIARAALKATLPDMAGELGTTLGQNFAEWSNLDVNKGKTWSEFLDEQPEALLHTALVSLVASGMHVGMGKAADMSQRKRVVQVQQALTSIFEQAKQFQMDPVTAETFLNKLTDDAKVFVNADELQNVLAQNNLELDSLPPSIAEQLALPSVTGDVEVSIGELMTTFAGTPGANQIAQHVRENQSGLSAAEWADVPAAEAALLRTAETIAAKQEQTAKTQSEVKVIEDELTKELEALPPLREKPFRPHELRAQARVAAAMYGTLAHIAGMSPAEVRAMTRPNILGPDGAAPPRAATVTLGAPSTISWKSGKYTFTETRTYEHRADDGRVSRTTVDEDGNTKKEWLIVKKDGAEVWSDGDQLRKDDDYANVTPQRAQEIANEDLPAGATGETTGETTGNGTLTQGFSHGNAMLNVGLDVGATDRAQKIDAAFVEAELNKMGVQVLSAKEVGGEYEYEGKAVKELTYVPQLSRPLTEAEVNALAIATGQEAIGHYAGGVGNLWGPNAANWGDFNPEFFKDQEGVTLSDAQKAELAQKKTKTPKITDILAGRVVEQSKPLSAKQWADVREIALAALTPEARENWLARESEMLAREERANREAEVLKEKAQASLDKLPKPRLSTVPLLHSGQKLKIVGTGKNGKLRVPDVGRALYNKFLGSAGDISTEEGVETVARALAHEALASMAKDGGAVGWYDRKVHEALLISSLIHPELATDPKANLAFRLIAAVTSNGQAVRDNFILTNEVYAQWKPTGQFPTELASEAFTQEGDEDAQIDGELEVDEEGNPVLIGGGQRRQAMIIAFQKLNALAAEHGWETLEADLMQLRTVGEIKKFFDVKFSGELVDTLVPSAVGLGGPKIGNFFANLSGWFDTPTMDLWFMRTVGRMTGGLLSTKKSLVKSLKQLRNILPEQGDVWGHDVGKMRAEVQKYLELPEAQQLDPEVTLKTLKVTARYARAQYSKFSAPDPVTEKTFTDKSPANLNARRLIGQMGAMIEAPGNGTERNQLRSVVYRTLELLEKQGVNLTAADLQAVLWYHEKNLYSQLGDISESAKPWDYASAARFGVGRALGLVDVGARQRAKPVGEGKPAGELQHGSVPGNDQVLAQLNRNVGAVAGPVVGIHYSQQPRTSLASSAFGSGMPGAERARLAAATDPRIKQRVAFYVNTGSGITPESGVGPHAHEATLRNLYDADADALKIWRNSKGDMNAAESAVLDAGFDGYLTRNFGGTGAVVMLGSRSVDVQGIKKEDVSSRAEIPPSAEIPKMKQAAMAIVNNRALPFGRQSVESWKRDIERSDPDTAALIKWDEIPAGDYYKDQIAAQLWQDAPALFAGQQEEARRGSFNPLTFDLRLLADANRSTFIHEASHFFMAAYIDMASRPDAPPALKQYVEDLLGYLFKTVPGGAMDGGAALGQGMDGWRVGEVNLFGEGSTVRDGSRVHKFAVRDQVGEELGMVSLILDKDDLPQQIVAISAIDLQRGMGAALVRQLMAASAEGLVIPQMMPGSVAFWQKMGVELATPTEQWEQGRGYITKESFERTPYFLGSSTEGAAGGREAGREKAAGTQEGASLDFTSGSGRLAQGGPLSQPGSPPSGRTNLERWNAMTLDQQRAYWEFFAEGFEQYAMTGKAPTKALQSAFSAFAKWMKDIYKTLATFVRQHGTKPLDAELTQFFDRMLATDEELDAARQERGFQALFKKAAEAGMSPGQFADYMALDDLQKVEAEELLRSRSLRDMKWLSNAKTKAMKELQAEADELRALVQASVEEELANTPIRQAERWLRKGEMVQDGEQIKATAGHRLDISVIRAIFPEKSLAENIDFAKLGRGSNALASSTGTQHPDDVAAIFGFRNGEDLVRQLIEMQPFKEEVQQLTDLRMLEEHGDLASPQAIAKAADEAIHNDAHLKMVATEVWALSNRTGSVAMLTRAAKAFAAQLVDNTVVKKLSPSQYANAATRAGKAAVRALAKKEVDKAANEKRTEMVNAAAAKAAYAAEAEVRAIVNRLRKISAYSDKHSATTSREFGVVQAVRAILSDFGIGQHGEKATKYLNTLNEYDPVLGAVLDDVINKLAPEVKPWDQLKVADLRELHAAINGLWTVARDVRSVELAGEKMSLDDARAQLIAKLEETQKTKAPTKAFSLTKAEERNQDFMSFAAKAIRPESWISTKDGLDSYGPWRRLIWNTIDRAELAYNADKTEKLKQLKALLEPIAADMVDVKIDAPELGGTFGAGRTIGYSELLHAILHTGNLSNKTKLLLGRGWGSLNEDGTLNSARWDAFMSRMFAEGRVTKAHMDFVQATWDLLESMKKGAQEAHKATTGRYFEEIEAAPLVTPYGTYMGGYAPAIVDHQLVAEADLLKMQNAAETEVIHSFEKPAGGFTKSRVAGYNQPLELNIAALGRHIDQVLLFSHMSIPVRNVQRVLKGKDLSSALAEQDRAALGSVLAPWLHSAATQTVTEKGKLSYESLSLFTKARSRAGAAIMFANVSNSVQQLTGFFPATLKVSKKELLFAAAKGWYKPRELAASVAEMSPYMQQRLANEVHAMAEEIDHILLNPTRFEKAQDWAIAHSYFLQMAVDTAMSPIIWQAKFNEETARGAAQQEAVDLADAAVRMTQGTNRAIDIAAMEKGSPFYRMFMQFAGYFNTQANLVGEKLAAEALLPKTPAKYGRIGMILAMGWWAPAIATALIVQLFRGGVDDDDKDGEWLDDWLVSTFIGAPIRYAVAAIPVFGTTINAAVNSFNNKPYDDRISVSPAVSLVEGGFRGAQAAYGAIEDPTKTGRAIRDLGTFLSLFTGVPVTPATRAAGFATDVETGKVSPTSGADYARGIITGVASPESKR